HNLLHPLFPLLLRLICVCVFICVCVCCMLCRRAGAYCPFFSAALFSRLRCALIALRCFFWQSSHRLTWNASCGLIRRSAPQSSQLIVISLTDLPWTCSSATWFTSVSVILSMIRSDELRTSLTCSTVGVGMLAFTNA